MYQGTPNLSMPIVQVSEVSRPRKYPRNMHSQAQFKLIIFLHKKKKYLLGALGLGCGPSVIRLTSFL